MSTDKPANFHERDIVGPGNKMARKSVRNDFKKLGV
jgi:hypothetical protein